MYDAEKLARVIAWEQCNQIMTYFHYQEWCTNDPHEDWRWDDDNYWKLANEDYRDRYRKIAADIIEGWEA